MSPGPLRRGRRNSLDVHAPTFSIKFAVKLIGYFCLHVAKYTEKLDGLRIRYNCLEGQTVLNIVAKFQAFQR